MTLERDFDVRVGTEWQQRLPCMGALLGAAVADEADGIMWAVVRVETWLVDPAVFPPQWIAAVRATLDEARRLEHSYSVSGNHRSYRSLYSSVVPPMMRPNVAVADAWSEASTCVYRRVMPIVVCPSTAICVLIGTPTADINDAAECRRS